MRRSLIKMFFIIASSIVFVGCGTSKSSEDVEIAMETSAMSTDTTESIVEESVAFNNEGQSVEVVENQKLIKTVNVNVETKEFDAIIESINSKIAELGGYLQYSEIYDNTANAGYRNAMLTIRIPAESLEDFVDGIERKTNVTYKNESVEDVTLEYVDVESHISALKIEQESLMNMLESASELEDIILIQSQLTEVRYQIESYESRKRTYDNKVNYSTVYIDIQEVDREVNTQDTGYWDEVIQKLSNNVYGLGKGIRKLSIWIIASIPYFIIIVVVVIIVINIKKILKRINNKNRFNNDKKED